MPQVSLKSKLLILTIILLLLSAIVGIIGNRAQHTITSNYKKIETDNIPNLISLYEGMVAMRTARTYITQLALPNINSSDAKDLRERINYTLKTYEEEDKKFNINHLPTGAEAVYKPFKEANEAMKADIFKAMELQEKSGGKDGASMDAMRKIITDDIADDAKTQQQCFFQMMDWQNKDIKNNGEIAMAASSSENKKSILSILLGILFGSILTYFILKNIIHEQNNTTKALNDSRKSFNMVEKSPINTMMSTPEGIITYMNEHSKQTLKTLQQYLKVKAEDAVGMSIEHFHKNPEAIKKIINNPKNLPCKAIGDVGTEKLELLISPIFDGEGKYLGPMVNWEIVTDKVQLVQDLTSASTELTNAATNVLTISNNLSVQAEETSAQANTASVASEEVNSGVQTVSSNMVEMTSSIAEITKTTGEAAKMTNQAMIIAKNANEMINQLGQSSMDIGEVIKVISSIAEQTNLLALNATIEAARAGEAGKGFAVVANEVKELAKQTAKATGEITKKIETIQNDSYNAVNAIEEIGIAIEKVNGFTTNIASAIEEQAAATNEVTRVISDSAEGVKQITENLIQVSQAASNTGKDAANAQNAAKGVGKTADLLKEYVSRLKV